MAVIRSVNLGVLAPNPSGRGRRSAIDKRPVSGPVEVRDPGPKGTGLGSGLVGDEIGDGRHHGGHDQAVYAVTREDLDRWSDRLGRELPDGFFGENLTTVGYDVNAALVGERWRVGSAELVVTCPRIPCATFRGWVGERGWLKLFTADARPGAYLAVVRAGRLQAGDALQVLTRPAHDVTVATVFRALTLEPELLPSLLVAEADLPAETVEHARARR